MGSTKICLRVTQVLFDKRVASEEFEVVALPHLNALYRTAVRLVRDRTEAPDLVQEAYLQAWKPSHRFEPGTNCRAWLFKILLNEVRHYRRRWFNTKDGSGREQSFGETLAFEPPVPEDTQDEDVLAALDESRGFLQGNRRDAWYSGRDSDVLAQPWQKAAAVETGGLRQCEWYRREEATGGSL